MNNLNKILGIFGLLVFVCLFTTVLNPSFIDQFNLFNITKWSALFGILSIGVAFVIITGGIDLSIGSVVGLTGCLLPMLIVEQGFSPLVGIALVMLVAGGIGWLHGILITKMDLQPFVVTLCGLLIYRGLARWITDDRTLGFGQDFDDLRLIATGKPCSWATMLLAAGVVLILLGLWKAFQSRSGPASSDHEQVESSAAAALPVALCRWSMPLVGVLLAIAGSARFWKGWQTADGPVLITAMGYHVRGISIIVPEESLAMPSSLMRIIGALVFVPALIGFLVWALKGDAKRSLRPLIGVVVSLFMLLFCIVTLVPIFRDSAPDDLWQIGAVQLSGSTATTFVMLIVFVVVALVVGMVGWLLSVGRSVSERAGSVMPLMVAGGVMLLLGQTPLAETMVPTPMLIMIGLAFLGSVFLNRTIFGRYLLALGRNEEAARYSGINTQRMTVLAYVLCSLAAGLGGVLFALEINSVQPSVFGNFWELYAIAAAVLGGCSLRGGEGNILGVVIGAAVMRVLYNAINMLGIKTSLELAIIGLVILAGVMVDVLVKRIAARKVATMKDSA